MTYSSLEARQSLVAITEEVVDLLGRALSYLGAAYERLDDQNADKLEAELFKPLQKAVSSAKLTQNGFADRHSLGKPQSEQPQHSNFSTQTVAELIQRAVETVDQADSTLAELQDSGLPTEAGDQQLRAGLADVRTPLSGIHTQAREFLRRLGR